MGVPNFAWTGHVCKIHNVKFLLFNSSLVINRLLANLITAIHRVTVTKHPPTIDRVDDMANSQHFNEVEGKQVLATEFLDHQFPLRIGTHAEVSCYLVYFEHLMAIRTDGTTTSLVTPSQFQDSDGCLDGPNVVSLSDGSTHVEIRLCNAPKSAQEHHSCIQDVRIDTVLATG